MKKIALLIAAISTLILSGCSSSNDAEPSFDEVLLSRRSVRSYQPDRIIEESQLRELFQAIQNAPSWANQQPSKYYVALSPESRNAVLQFMGSNKAQVANASALIVSTYERGKSGFFQGQQANEIGDGWGAHDNGLSNAYLVLKARAMGFDSLIMGIRDADGLHRLFDIPENETVMAVIALGYRAGDPAIPVHKPLDNLVKFF